MRANYSARGETFEVGLAVACVERIAVEIVREDAFRRNEGRSQIARKKELSRVPVAAHADVAKSVENTLVDEDTVGVNEIIDPLRVRRRGRPADRLKSKAAAGDIRVVPSTRFEVAAAKAVLKSSRAFV